MYVCLENYINFYWFYFFYVHIIMDLIYFLKDILFPYSFLYFDFNERFFLYSMYNILRS